MRSRTPSGPESTWIFDVALRDAVVAEDRRCVIDERPFAWHLPRDTALEVDAEVQPAGEERPEGDQQQHERDGEPDLAPPTKSNVVSPW